MSTSTSDNSRQPYTATDQADWTRSDEYHNSFLHAPDDALEHAQRLSDERGLPKIAVSAAQGKFLHLLVKSLGARRIVEVGTLGGYSTIWLAKALPEDGQLITLELNAENAKIAAENLAFANLDHKVKIIIGPAAESLRTLEPNPPFDLVFIDADKPGNLTYFLEAKRLVKTSGVIIVDNVVRFGRVADPAITDDKSVNGVRALLNHLQGDKGVEATTLATVGEKGYDGLLYAVKL